MIDTKRLECLIKGKGYTNASFASELGMCYRTFMSKLEKGVFKSDEIYLMIEKLEIKKPMEVFFCKHIVT